MPSSYSCYARGGGHCAQVDGLSFPCLRLILIHAMPEEEGTVRRLAEEDGRGGHCAQVDGGGWQRRALCAGRRSNTGLYRVFSTSSCPFPLPSCKKKSTPSVSQDFNGLKAPVARKIPVAISAHGRTWYDPYQWMSNLIKLKLLYDPMCRRIVVQTIFFTMGLAAMAILYAVQDPSPCEPSDNPNNCIVNFRSNPKLLFRAASLLSFSNNHNQTKVPKVDSLYKPRPSGGLGIEFHSQKRIWANKEWSHSLKGPRQCYLLAHCERYQHQ